MFAFDVVDRLPLPACKKYSCCSDLIMFHVDMTLNHSGCNLDFSTLINRKQSCSNENCSPPSSQYLAEEPLASVTLLS